MRGFSIRCLRLDQNLRNHPLTQSALVGLNANRHLGLHAHLLGFGESGGGG